MNRSWVDSRLMVMMLHDSVINEWGRFGSAIVYFKIVHGREYSNTRRLKHKIKC